MALVPLIRDYGAGAVFAYRDGRSISVRQFLRDVEQLAALLPARRHVLNLCSDRYHFVVGFAAALVREHVSLLPPNQTPNLIAQLSDRYPDLYCLTDTAPEHHSLTTVAYPRAGDGDCSERSVPAIPAAQVAAIVFTSGSTGHPVLKPKILGAGSSEARAPRLIVSACGRFPAWLFSRLCRRSICGLESTC